MTREEGKHGKEKFEICGLGGVLSPESCVLCVEQESDMLSAVCVNLSRGVAVAGLTCSAVQGIEPGLELGNLPLELFDLARQQHLRPEIAAGNSRQTKIILAGRHVFGKSALRADLAAVADRQMPGKPGLRPDQTA